MDKKQKAMDKKTKDHAHDLVMDDRPFLMVAINKDGSISSICRMGGVDIGDAFKLCASGAELISRVTEDAVEHIGSQFGKLDGKTNSKDKAKEQLINALNELLGEEI